MESLKRLLVQAWMKPLVWLLCLLPLAWLWWQASTGAYVNPEEALVRGAGDWSLRMLCLTLAVTPLRVRARLPALARYRRMLGLFTFFYACLHLLSYGWLDMGLQVADIGHDILKRPFILVGFVGWLLLVPLAATSFNRAVRALGARQWLALHRLVYAIAPLALLHFFWMRAGKNDFAEVAVYGIVIGALLLERLQRNFQAKSRASA